MAGAAGCYKHYIFVRLGSSQAQKPRVPLREGGKRLTLIERHECRGLPVFSREPLPCIPGLQPLAEFLLSMVITPRAPPPNKKRCLQGAGKEAAHHSEAGTQRTFSRLSPSDKPTRPLRSSQCGSTQSMSGMHAPHDPGMHTPHVRHPRTH